MWYLSTQCLRLSNVKKPDFYNNNEKSEISRLCNFVATFLRIHSHNCWIVLVSWLFVSSCVSSRILNILNFIAKKKVLPLFISIDYSYRARIFFPCLSFSCLISYKLFNTRELSSPTSKQAQNKAKKRREKKWNFSFFCLFNAVFQRFSFFSCVFFSLQHLQP